MEQSPAVSKEEKQRTLKIIRLLRQEYPDVHCSLNFSNPLELLVATILSAHYREQPDIAGNRVDGTPNRTWSLAGEYRPSWLDPNLKVTAGAYHTGTQALNADNLAFTRGYTTFDLGASYTFEVADHTVVARVNGQNITGKRYWASVGGNSLASAVPGSVKFSLSVQY